MYFCICPDGDWIKAEKNLALCGNTDLEFENVLADHFDDEIENEEMVKETNYEEWQLIAKSVNSNPIQNVKLGMRDYDLDFNFNQNFDYTEEKMNEYLNFIEQQKKNFLKKEKNRLEIQLTSEQMKVINILKRQISSLLKKETPDIRKTIIQGKAGCGKSTIIRKMIEEIEKIFGEDSYILAAPTGVAATNIGGKTIHSALKIFNFTDISESEKIKMQNEYKNLKFVILDEYSMIGAKLLCEIDRRLKQITGQKEIDFGGICIYLFGDIRQLPPVLDRVLYKDYKNITKDGLSEFGRILFVDFEASIFLENSMRQKGKDQKVFRELLDRLSAGESTKADYNLLFNRRFSCFSKQEMEEFKHAIRLYHKNEDVNLYNITRLKCLNKPCCKITSLNDFSNPEEYEIEYGLPFELILAEGCIVMLRHNLWIEQGLVNGSLGIVEKILFNKNESQRNHLPKIILVKFLNYEGPTVDGCVPIKMVTKSWYKNGKIYTRTQFPLTLAFAITIHKSQGLTLEKVIMKIPETEKPLGITYVGMSRVKKLTDLCFETGFNFKRLEDIKKSNMFEAVKDAIADLKRKRL